MEGSIAGLPKKTEDHPNFLLQLINPTGGGMGSIWGLREGRGDLQLLLRWFPSATWLVLEADIEAGVDLGDGVWKVPKAQVIFKSDSLYSAIECLTSYTNTSVRKWVCADPQWACTYAQHLDRVPADDTREAACRDPKQALKYALFVDKCSRDDTRNAACQEPYTAFLYAFRVDGMFLRQTANAARKDPKWDYAYRLCVEFD